MAAQTEARCQDRSTIACTPAARAPVAGGRQTRGRRSHEPERVPSHRVEQPSTAPQPPPGPSHRPRICSFPGCTSWRAPSIALISSRKCSLPLLSKVRRFRAGTQRPSESAPAAPRAGHLLPSSALRLEKPTKQRPTGSATAPMRATPITPAIAATTSGGPFSTLAKRHPQRHAQSGSRGPERLAAAKMPHDHAHRQHTNPGIDGHSLPAGETRVRIQTLRAANSRLARLAPDRRPGTGCSEP